MLAFERKRAFLRHKEYTNDINDVDIIRLKEHNIIIKCKMVGDFMYMSVSDAAKKFHISARRVQALCAKGRIPGATRVSGVWLIPKDAEKPADARKNRKMPENQMSLFDDIFSIYNIKAEMLTMDQVCKLFSISQATAKNWVRLGKLKKDPETGTFDKVYIEALWSEIKSGKDNRLKSRRNKKTVSGNVLYKDYIKNENNCEVVEHILNSCEHLTESELRVILAYFAIQHYEKSGGVLVSEQAFLDGAKQVSENSVFNELISDLLGNVDVTKLDLTNIQSALECQIEFVPSEDTLGFIYISLKDLGQRKQTGIYFTPKKTVNTLIDNLKRCMAFAGKTVCDPCCGTGNFLIGLIEKGVPAERLYGQDIDEISILLTRINMFLLDNSMTKEQLYTQFVCGNTLTDTFDGKFSVVLGNPPWGYDFSQEEIAQLIDGYVTAKKKGMESYDLFIEKGLAMLETDGYLAYVLPEALLSVTSHQQAREIIVKNTAFKFVCYLGNAFAGVQCPAIILGIQNGNQGETDLCRVEENQESFVIHGNREVDASLFSFNMNDEEYACLYSISSVDNARYLAGNARFALGIVTGDNKEYIRNIKEDGMEIILKGSDVYRYGIKNTDNYIYFAPEKFQQVAPTEVYRAEEKLLYRFISEVPVFTYDNKQTLSLNSCNILIPQIDGMDMKYVLAVLNSSVAAYFMHKKYNSVKLLRSHIESLPIPMVDAEKQYEIIQKVNDIMNGTGDVLGLYKELDEIIMDIYSLTDKQKETIKMALEGKHTFLR